MPRALAAALVLLTSLSLLGFTVDALVSGAGGIGAALRDATTLRRHPRAWATTLRGNGLLATTQVGKNGNDVLFGTNGADVVVMLGGDDVVFGLNWNGWAAGEAGADSLNGDAGNDTLTDPAGLDVGDGGTGLADRCDSRFASLSNCEIIF